MSEWNIIHFMNVSPEEQQNPLVINRCTEAYKTIKPKRAEIIEAALSV